MHQFTKLFNDIWAVYIRGTKRRKKSHPKLVSIKHMNIRSIGLMLHPPLKHCVDTAREFLYSKLLELVVSSPVASNGDF